ncbi:MAG: hypothetical protein JWO99_337 [Candidatus Saccharibacteria bacterium]|nr:hypothetical protein [Candidatus Saccharibacteria bacterium]
MTNIIVKDKAMTSKAKDLMIDGAIRLLATRGLQATSFTEVLELTGAPRGSIYYHFPLGKDQMIAEAVTKAGQNTLDALRKKAGSSALEITEYFLDLWRQLLTYSEFRAGCSVLAVTVATDSPELLEATSNVFQKWQDTLADLLEQGGLNEQDAKTFALQLVVTTEGAVVVARAQKSIKPFETIATQLLDQLKSKA